MDLGLTEEQIERYSRHILLGEVGGEGQRRLLDSSAFVVGAGGLGSPALMYLAAAGVGRITIVDGDVVDLSGLQRQVVHGTPDVGKSKALSAQETLSRINPECKVEAIGHPLRVDNVRDLLRQCDVALDCSDNFPTRFLVADSCRFEGVPLVTAAVIRFQGQLMTVLPGKGHPCYRCFIPQPPPPGTVPGCQQVGVLGAAAGVMGTLEAVEAIKVLLGLEGIMSDRLLLYDALQCSFRTLRRRPDPACPLCGENPSITDLAVHGDGPAGA